ncbi:MAG: M13 family peptidase, partial [Clostridia bacterium]|nr:M13 family peptidase [Deltaproteobacteria bacterium]
SAIADIAKLVNNVPVSTWRDYLTFKLVKGSASVLSKTFVDESFAFSGKIVQGIEQIQERWKRAVDFTSGNLGEAVGKLYVAKYFPPDTKRRADELVKNVIAAMGERLSTLAWMTPETKTKAQAKLDAFTAKIGYPEVWRDYSAVETRADDLYGNNKRASVFEYERNLTKLEGPVDRREWFMTPMTVNAYANPVMNEIVFPAAIMQPPFFDPNADDAVNYGGIGAVIGHEISHHFDDQGRKYDKSGALTDWWSEEDVKRFNALTDKVVEQFDGFEPLPGLHVNGKLTLGENIADLAGITVAYDAYQKSLGGEEASLIDGTSGDQRFYFGWAQVWRGKYREQALRQRLLTDPHSPSAVRAGIVRNLDPWYAAFAVVPGQTMYLGPDERLRVW